MQSDHSPVVPPTHDHLTSRITARNFSSSPNRKRIRSKIAPTTSTANDRQYRKVNSRRKIGQKFMLTPNGLTDQMPTSLSDTECSPIETECLPIETECVAIETECVAIETECVAIETECLPIETECISSDTEYLPNDTKCLPSDTECLPNNTERLPTDSVCLPTDRVCLPIETECISSDTEYLPNDTKCLPNNTECLPTDRVCLPIETECISSDTEYLPNNTKCLRNDTECLPNNTERLPIDRVCLPIETECISNDEPLPTTLPNHHPVDMSHLYAQVETPTPNYSETLGLTPSTGSVQEGKQLFGVLVKPLTADEFMEKYWEKEPFRVDRHCVTFFQDLLSTGVVDHIMRRNYLEFNKNIQIKIKAGNESINPVGRAMPPTIWHYYLKGFGITFLNPQTFVPTIHAMIATLQEYFQCMIESNIYVGSEYSDHYPYRYENRDIFVLQMEGAKLWRVFTPLCESNILSREARKVGRPCTAPVMEALLKGGDFLYIPRGYVFEAVNTGHHSLHLQLRLYYKHTYADLLEVLFPIALKEAAKDNVSLRKGVPIDIWRNLGVVNCDNFSAPRSDAIKKIKNAFETVCRHFRSESYLDDAVDKMALKYQHGALPPKLTPAEESCTVYGTNIICCPDGSPEYPYIEMDTKLRLVRENVVRMVRHANGIRVYYSSDNSTDHHARDETFIDMDPQDAPAIEVLVKAYPSYTAVRDLQLESNAKNLFVAQDLWERGTVMSDKPLV